MSQDQQINTGLTNLALETIQLAVKLEIENDRKKQVDEFIAEKRPCIILNGENKIILSFIEDKFNITNRKSGNITKFEYMYDVLKDWYYGKYETDYTYPKQDMINFFVLGGFDIIDDGLYGIEIDSNVLITSPIF